MTHRIRSGAVALAALVVVALAASACGSNASNGTTGTTTAGGADKKVTLTVYTDQHAELVLALTEAYTKATGVRFNIQNDATVGQIKAEGKASKADVYLTEDPGPAAQLAAAGLLSKIDAATLAQVRPGLSSKNGLWVAYAARSRVLYYNPKLISADELPKTLADITKPEYKGMFAWAPSGAFVATVQYLIDTKGEAATKTFLEGIKANGVNEHKNGNVRDTVEAGKHAMGLSNHYYWWVLASQKGGSDKLTSKIYHFPTVDPGNLILSSGAGILKSSKQQNEAQAFVEWLTAPDGGQKLIATAPTEVSEAQYPVAVGVASDVSGDLTDVKSPEFEMDSLADSTEAENLLKQLGMSS